MNIKHVQPQVFLITYDTQEELCAAFLPFQEYYENIQFADKEFSLIEFKSWYASTFGNFTYYTDWSGFNLPLSVINYFEKSAVLQKLAQSHSSSNALYLLLQMLKNTNDASCYVIGVVKGDDSTLAHELAHARFYLDTSYRDKITSILNASTQLEPLKTHLLAESYHPKVLIDEIQAYLLTDDGYLYEHGLMSEHIKDLIKVLKLV